MEEVGFVVTTVDSLEKARKLARSLVEKKLAACVSISSAVESFYWWKGKIEEEKEYQLWIKTYKENFSKIEEFFKKDHPYEVPEIGFIPWKEVGKGYAMWMKEYLKEE